jgi:hypothetical protein
MSVRLRYGGGVYPNVDAMSKRAGISPSWGYFSKLSMSETDITSAAALHGVPVLVTSEPAAVGSASAPRFAGATTASAEGSLLRTVFSFPVMLATFLVGRVFYEARAFYVDPDLWWHIKVGQDILTTHHWPTSDPFSYTVAGNPWMAYEWLGDVLFGAVARWGGLLGLEILLFALASAVMLALYAYATLRSGNSKAGFVSSGLLCSLAFASFNLRPQMLGYLFLVLTLIALERFRQGKQRSAWFLPVLFLIWINAHGSWVIGLGVLFVFLASGLVEFRWGGIQGRRWSSAERMRLEAISLLCLTAIPLTPYGTRLAAYPFTVASNLPLNVGNILEWQPMPFNTLGGKLFLAAVLAFFLAQMVTPLTLRLSEVVLLFGGIVMACLHVRFLLLFVPFAAPIFAVVLARWLPPYDRKKDHPVLNAVLMAVAVVAIVRYFPTNAGLEKIVARVFPVRAVEYLRQHPVPGPMFNNYGYGGYLVGKLPEQKVFIDGRGDLYEDAGVFGEYLELAQLKPAAFEVLRAHNIQSCLLDSKEPLATVLAVHPDWDKRYSDGVSVLYVRRYPLYSRDTPTERAPRSPKE